MILEKSGGILFEILDTRYSYISSKCIFKCRCSKCGGISEYSLENEEKLEDEKCLVCGAGNNKEGEDTNFKYNIEIRLKQLYKRLCKNKKYSLCTAWLEDFEVFKDWAIENGYRSWKLLDIKDKNRELSPENCTWKSREIKRELGVFDDSYIMSVKYIENIISASKDLDNQLNKVMELLESIKSGTKFNDSSIIEECIDKLSEIYYLKDEFDTQFDGIDVEVNRVYGKKT